MTTFHQRKRNRNVAILCLCFFVAIGAASVVGMWVGAPADRRIYAVAMFAIFWGAWAALATWMLLAYWLERLEIRGESIFFQGVVGMRELSLAHVTAARWRVGQDGRVVLRSLAGKLVIHFGNFERAERLWLIRYLRGKLPESVQHDWGLFCHKVALPLQEHDAQIDRPPADGEVAITRRRWDWYFVPSIVISAGIGIVLYSRLGQPRFLPVSALLTFLWLFLRYTTPKKGLVTKRLNAQPMLKRFLWFELVWGTLGLGGIGLFNFLNPPKPLALPLGTTGLVLWFGVLLWRARMVDRERLRQDLEQAAESLVRWRESEAAVPHRISG